MFRKGRGTRDQIANIHWITEKAREFQKNIHFCFIDYAKAFDCVDHNKLWEILKEVGIQDHITCLLRNLYAGQEATVRTRHETISSVQFSCSVVSNSLRPHEPQHSRPLCPSPSPRVYSNSCPMIPSNHLILCHLLLLPLSIFPSIRVFSNESVFRIRWPKYWSFSFSINPSNEYSGLISFRMDWLDLLAFQGTLKSLLQHHSSKASIL